MKRLLLCLVLLLCACAAIPESASAWPIFTVFTFQADPLDPLGTTNTGWFRAPENIPLRYGFTWNSPNPYMDFWWQTQHWTGENTMMSFAAEDQYYDAMDSFRVDGGLENLGGNWLFGYAPLGNSLDHPFDFTMSFEGGPFFLGETYTCTMWYVNPTASHNAANGSYYIATGTFYVTNDQPAPSQHPGIPEPGSLALLALGVGAVIAAKRIRGVNPSSPSDC